MDRTHLGFADGGIADFTTVMGSGAYSFLLAGPQTIKDNQKKRGCYSARPN
jgi:hypothetical protein